MKKYVILILVGFFSLVSVAALAQTDASSINSAEAAEIENAGILPSNPFYFLKEWKRGITKVFAFSAEKKAELELKEAEERAAEMKKLEELKPEKTEALEKAAENYQENMERLQSRLEALKETSENPNVEELINRIVDKSIEHQEIFVGLQEKMADKEQVMEKLQASREKIDDMISNIPEELKDSEALREKLQLREANQLKEENQIRIINQTVSSTPDIAPGAIMEKKTPVEEIIIRDETDSSGKINPIKAINEYVQEKKEEIQERKREQNCIQAITYALSPEGICKEFPTPCDVPADWKTVEFCPGALETDNIATSSPSQSASSSISN